MRDTAQVIGLTKTGMVEVIPLIQDACLSCSVSGCTKRGTTFTVANPHNFPLTSGTLVQVSASTRHQVIQAIVSILIPILSAVTGQIALNYHTHLIISDGFKAAILLLSLFVPAILIFFISSKKKLIQSEITKIVE